MIYTPENILKHVEKLFYNFLWDGKPAKIKKNTIIAPISLGGLSMTDIFSVHKAAKCIWIKRLNDESKGKWKSLFWIMLHIDIRLLNRNINYKKITGKTKFHTQVLESWYKLIGTEPKVQDDIANQFIAHNQYIKINGKPINDQSLYNIQIKDIYGNYNQKKIN